MSRDRVIVDEHRWHTRVSTLSDSYAFSSTCRRFVCGFLFIYLLFKLTVRAVSFPSLQSGSQWFIYKYKYMYTPVIWIYIDSDRKKRADTVIGAANNGNTKPRQKPIKVSENISLKLLSTFRPIKASIHRANKQLLLLPFVSFPFVAFYQRFCLPFRAKQSSKGIHVHTVASSPPFYSTKPFERQSTCWRIIRVQKNTSTTKFTSTRSFFVMRNPLARKSNFQTSFSSKLLFLEIKSRG